MARGDWALEHTLTIHRILESGTRLSPGRMVVGADGSEVSYAGLARRVGALASALEELGVRGASGRWAMGTRVATLCWNTLEHLEAYLAVPMMGAVLHPVNVRLAPSR